MIIPKRKRIEQSIVFLTLLVLGVTVAWSLRFIQDDAYISFRYVVNWLNGNGIVWNIGERVEGYSNFLWIILLLIPTALGFGIEETSIALGMLFYVGSLIVIYRLTFRLTNRGVALVTTLLLTTNITFAAYATGGLETSLHTFICWLSLYFIFDSRVINPVYCTGISFLFALSVLCRMDSVVFLLVPGMYMLTRIVFQDISWGKRMVQLSALILPVTVVVIIWTLFRWNYYGDLLPNTYYAKSQGITMDSLKLGIFFIWSFLKTYGLLPFLFAGVACVFYRDARMEKKIAVVFISTLLAWSVYLVKIGGGFMEFRFMVVVMPLIMIFVSVLILELNNVFVRSGLVVGLILFSFGTQLSVKIGGWYTQQLNDTGSFSVIPLRVLKAQTDPNRPLQLDAVGNYLNENFRNILVSVSPAGIMPFRAMDINFVDMFGLNDRWVPKNGAKKSDRRGHQKIATLSYLIDRGVNIVVETPSYVPLGDENEDVLKFEDLIAEFVLLNPEAVQMPGTASILLLPFTDTEYLVVLYLSPHPSIDEFIKSRNIKQIFQTGVTSNINKLDNKIVSN